MARRGRSRGLFMGKAFGKRGHFSKVVKTKDEKTSAADESALNGVTLVNGYASLPTSGIQNGTLYRTSDQNKVWLYVDGGWYLAATLTNTAPVISGVNDAISINSTTATTVITATAVDSEYMPLTWSYTTSGLGNMATISHTDGTFTITTGSDPSTFGTFTLNIIVTDGKFTTTASTSVTMVNAGPTPITGINSSYVLNGRGGADTVLTAISADPDGFPLTWSYTITSGSLNGTTIAQADNVFTINPHDTQDANFELTISASDGANAATKAVSFSLAHMPQVDILVVGGGGGGAARGGGGGGGGEYKIWTGTLTANTVYTASAGSGGADPNNWQSGAGAGTRSQFYDGVTWRIRAGGGGGGSTVGNAGSYSGGGSTGGGAQNVTSSAVPTDIYNSSTDFGTGYRARGGSGNRSGGAGAGEAGGVQTTTYGGGPGGDGKQWLDGNYYAGGGSGGTGTQTNSSTPGGLGGGGDGRDSTAYNGTHGTGGGGGGAHESTHAVYEAEHQHDGYQAGSFGGNGIVIIRVPSSEWQPTVTGSYWTTTTSGGYTYYKCVRLGAYGGSGDTWWTHTATSLAFEAARGTVTGTLEWQ